MPAPRGNLEGSLIVEEARSSETKRARNIPAQFVDRYQRTRHRLGCLRKVQKDLETRLGAASSEESSNGTALPYDPTLGLAAAESKRRNPNEFVVNSSNGWKSALTRVRPLLPNSIPDNGPGSTMTGKDAMGEQITEIIAQCREDIIALWSDPLVREILSRSAARIEDTPGL